MSTFKYLVRPKGSSPMSPNDGTEVTRAQEVERNKLANWCEGPRPSPEQSVCRELCNKKFNTKIPR